MKKYNSLLMIALCIIFCISSIGIDILFWKHFPALYLACVVIGSIAVVICVVCLALRLKNNSGEERYYKRLVLTSMISASTALGILCIGTLITMFM